MMARMPRIGFLRSPTTKRLIRAYGPVILLATLFLAMALLVPTLDKTVSP
jgi:hypothetical protein